MCVLKSVRVQSRVRFCWREPSPSCKFGGPPVCTAHYVVSNDERTVTSTQTPNWRVALALAPYGCTSQSSSCAFRIDGCGPVLLGVARLSIDVTCSGVVSSDDFWGVRSDHGYVFHGSEAGISWPGMQPFTQGDTIGLQIVKEPAPGAGLGILPPAGQDTRSVALCVWKNGVLLGQAVATRCREHELCFAVAMSTADNSITIVR